LEAEKRHKVLFVEDHGDSRELISILLASLGVDVITAGSIAEAVPLMTNEKYDLYLLDSQLPDGSGLDLCKQIRANDAKVPIVFYSALGYPADIKEGLEAGAQEYIVKPDGIDRLETTINSLIKGPASRSAAP